MTSSNLKIVGIFLIFILINAVLIFTFLPQGSSASKEEVQAIVKEYIESNPELIIKTLTEYQQNSHKAQAEEAQKAIANKKAELESDPATPVAGNPKGDVTIVEFFDYSCGYCKKVAPYISQIIKEDPSVRVAFKELPILGPNSLLTSQAALAVNLINPEKYLDFHNALMKERTSSKDAILKIASDLGLNADEISKKMDSEEIQKALEANQKLASEIGINGTPAFVINGEFIPGAIEYDELKQRVKAARAAK